MWCAAVRPSCALKSRLGGLLHRLRQRPAQQAGQHGHLGGSCSGPCSPGQAGSQPPGSLQHEPPKPPWGPPQGPSEPYDQAPAREPLAGRLGEASLASKAGGADSARTVSVHTASTGDLVSGDPGAAAQTPPGLTQHLSGEAGQAPPPPRTPLCLPGRAHRHQRGFSFGSSWLSFRSSSIPSQACAPTGPPGLS